MNVYIVWEDRAEKGDGPELVEIFATAGLAHQYIAQQDDEMQEVLDIEEREVNTTPKDTHGHR